jgi:drug/metabolite transporter (DMT)-like permease
MAALTGGAVAMLNRFVLKEHDYISYGFIFNILAAVFFIPFIISDFSIPSQPQAIGYAALGVALWTVVAAVGFKASKLVEVSLKNPLGQTRLIFLLILSSIFLFEVLTLNKLAGTLLIFVGLVTLTYDRKGKGGKMFGKMSDTGVKLILLTALLTAISAIVDKTVLSYWSIPMYSFIAFLFPGLVLGAATMKRKKEFVKMVKTRAVPIFVSSLLIVIDAFLVYSAYKMTDVSNVFPVMRLSTLVGVVGGIVLLKERKDILKKISASIIMILGAILIRG